MKVYELYSKPKTYKFPDQTEKILSYLHKHGDIKVSDMRIESLFEVFLTEQYWMIDREAIDLNDRLLRDFAEWLDEYIL